MYTHSPENYLCPICRDIGGVSDEFHSAEDVVYQDELTYAFISPHWWDTNPGHVLVVPREHYENIYAIPDRALGSVFTVARKMAIAIRQTYDGCHGIALRQFNEPSSGQDVWHFHVHVSPCYGSDESPNFQGEFRFAEAAKRLPYAKTLRDHLASVNCRI